MFDTIRKKSTVDISSERYGQAHEKARALVLREIKRGRGARLGSARVFRRCARRARLDDTQWYCLLITLLAFDSIRADEQPPLLDIHPERIMPSARD